MNWFALLKLKVFILCHKNFKIALDMKCVDSMREDFWRILGPLKFKNKLNVFNVNAQVMALMMLRSYDKYLNIYADESDFWENSRAIVNRQFKVF
jgi:hypothetical protein